MKKITECRACGSKALTPVFSLPSPEPRFDALGRRKQGEAKFVLCDPSRDAGACGLLQSAYARTPAPEMFEPSGRYAVNRSHLRQLATEALEAISGRDCAALDIGCNDGTLLSFYPRWVDRYGVDSAEVVEDIGDWAWTAKTGFPSAELDRAFGDKKFDIVTAASVLEYVAEPRAFFARIKSLLASDGVLALETLYSPMTLTRTAVEPFVGGAVAVYSLGVLERLLRECELKIFRGALTDKEGGSVRLYITHADATEHDFDPWYERLARLWDEENSLSLRARQPYQAFERRAGEARQAFRSLLADIAARGESVHLLGAGPHSAAIYTLAGGEAGAIKAIVAEGGARNCPLVDLPVISETESRAAEPDYLLAPASLKREMMERWRESILLGARMIVPTPEPHVIHTHNYASELGKALAGRNNAGSVETLRTILGAFGAPRLVAGKDAANSAGKAASG
ncbi:MAG TPA: methyltransferase domain-containing protein [Amphiplicatus sp.]|nr:methyltransferase domain-containing protein [Amphiplicatus sp.]HRX39596.1 methyltransferase domain-containing protein [Parvularculaceae bacterium]